MSFLRSVELCRPMYFEYVQYIIEYGILSIEGRKWGWGGCCSSPVLARERPKTPNSLLQTELVHQFYDTYLPDCCVNVKQLVSFCARGPPIMARLGTRNLITDVGQNCDVEKVIVHPGYQAPCSYNDIALLKLKEELKFTKTLRPACLPLPTSTSGDPGNRLTATGRGRTGYGKPNIHMSDIS